MGEPQRGREPMSQEERLREQENEFNRRLANVSSVLKGCDFVKSYEVLMVLRKLVEEGKLESSTYAEGSSDDLSFWLKPPGGGPRKSVAEFRTAPDSHRGKGTVNLPATYYLYDDHGNFSKIVRTDAGRITNTTNYQYDYHDNGNVKQVADNGSVYKIDGTSYPSITTETFDESGFQTTNTIAHEYGGEVFKRSEWTMVEGRREEVQDRYLLDGTLVSHKDRNGEVEYQNDGKTLKRKMVHEFVDDKKISTTMFYNEDGTTVNFKQVGKEILVDGEYKLMYFLNESFDNGGKLIKRKVTKSVYSDGSEPEEVNVEPKN